MDGNGERSERPRFQFQLRWLLVLTALVAWAFGWLGAGGIAVMILMATAAMIEAGCDPEGRWFDCLVRNLAAFFVSSLVFGAIGWGLMWGSNPTGWFGTDDFLFAPMRAGCPTWEQYEAAVEHSNEGQEVVQAYNRYRDWEFNHVFCAWAIALGHIGLAGRANWRGYLLFWVAAAGLVYPIVGNWIHEDGGWGDPSWLARIGFDPSHYINWATNLPMMPFLVTAGGVAMAGAVAFRPREPLSRLDLASPHCRRWLAGLGYAIPGVLVLALVGLSWVSSLSDGSSPPNELLTLPIVGLSGALAAAIGTLLGQRRLFGPALSCGLFAGTLFCIGCAIQDSFLPAAILGAVLGLSLVALTWLLARLRCSDAGGAAAVFSVCAAWSLLGVLVLQVFECLPDLQMISDVISRPETFADLLRDTRERFAQSDFPWHVWLLAAGVSLGWVTTTSGGVFFLIRRLPSLQSARYRAGGEPSLTR